jgi:peptidyl-dipeptidase A
MTLSALSLRASVAALAIAFAAPLAAQDAGDPVAEAATQYPETPEGAQAWLAAVEADFAAFSEEYAHVSWINATYITHDTDTLAAKYGAELTLKQVGYANEAARYAATASRCQPRTARARLRK